ETDPTVPSWVKEITQEDINKWNSFTTHNPVTLSGENYIELINQHLTVKKIDLVNHTVGNLPISRGGTGMSTVGTPGQVLRSNGSSLEYYTLPNYLTTETDPTVPAHVKSISVTDIDNWNAAYNKSHDFVTLTGHNYLSISDQQINAGNINLSTHTSGILPITKGGTGLSFIGGAGTILRSTGSELEYWMPDYIVTETDPTVPSWVKEITSTDIDNWNNAFNSIHSPVTLIGEGYLTISNQEITVGKVNIVDHTVGTLSVA